MKKIGIFAFAVAMLAAPTLVSAQSWGASSVQTPAWGSPPVQTPSWGGTPAIGNCMALEICPNQPPAPNVNCDSTGKNCTAVRNQRNTSSSSVRR